MVGNFFRVVCPFLYELETVAWFALYPDRHSRTTLDRIRQTTQVMIDVHHLGDDIQIQPIKAWQRQSPTMFLPHREQNGHFIPVTDNSDATRLQAGLELAQLNRQPLLDYWDRLFLQVAHALEANDEKQSADVLNRVLNVLISRDPRMLDLAKRYLSLEDLLAIRTRMIGSGYIGGKATGMLIARSILLTNQPDIWQENLEPHDSSYLGSDAYYAFLVHNGLWPLSVKPKPRLFPLKFP
ncbi:MAG: PEP/pyruvate-binding domain-containing protein, partial [Marinobacter sp.]